MENLNDKFISSLKRVSLSAAEKGEIKTALMAQITRQETAPSRPVASPYFSWLVIFQSRRLQVTFASFFAVIIIGSTVIVGANNSLPGDLLYPVKTNFNESVQRSLVPTDNPAAQVDFETSLVEKRFQEAEQLDNQQQLNGERKVQVKKAIEDQAQKAVTQEIETEHEANITAPAAQTMTTMRFSARMAATSTAISDTDLATTTTEASSTEEMTIPSKDEQPSESGNRLQRVFENHKKIIEKLDISDE